MPVYIYHICFFALLLFSSACRQDIKNDQTKSHEEFNEKGAREQFIQVNKQQVRKENDDMDYYVRSRGMPFIKTLSGIRYYVYKPSASGDSIKPGMQITIDYEVRLMDGTLCYSSRTDGKRTFVVGQEDIESGIHKGVQYLKTGDQALLLIPSVLAHGLLGDRKKIPPQTPIVYDIKIDRGS